MTLLGRSIVRSTGYEGAPGFNIIHWSAGLGPGPSDPDAVGEWHDTLEAAFTELLGSFVSGVVFTIEASVVYFDASDGVLVGATTDPNGDRTMVGTGAGGSLSRATCYAVNTRTDDFVNGRRLRGRMFLGPIHTGVINLDGQIGQATANAVGDAFDGCISGLGARLAVWHRPTEAAPTSGSYGDVTSVQCNTVPGTLRSRKT